MHACEQLLHFVVLEMTYDGGQYSQSNLYSIYILFIFMHLGPLFLFFVEIPSLSRTCSERNISALPESKIPLNRIVVLNALKYTIMPASINQNTTFSPPPIWKERLLRPLACAVQRKIRDTPVCFASRFDAARAPVDSNLGSLSLHGLS
jgi:hypothetical protein